MTDGPFYQHCCLESRSSSVAVTCPTVPAGSFISRFPAIGQILNALILAIRTVGEHAFDISGRQVSSGNPDIAPDLRAGSGEEYKYLPVHGRLGTYTFITRSLSLTMSAPKKFVVFTATGDQGSSVCRSLLKEGYHVVGLTRNPESEGAKGMSLSVPVPA
jgi:hypothetical protein